MKLFAFIVGAFFSLNSWAQPAPPKAPPTIHFAAIVQHVLGQVNRVEPGAASTEVVFKSVLYEGDTLKVAAKGRVKLVSRNECTGVVYGPAQVTVPSPGAAWRVRSEFVRWICPPNHQELLNIRGARFTVDGGEFFLAKKQLLVLRDTVTSSLDAEPLHQMQLYNLEDKKWKLTAGPNDESDLWAANTLQPAPRESVPLTRPKIERNWRLIVSPSTGLSYINHENQSLNEGIYKYNGVNLELQHRYHDRAWILRFNNRESQDPNASKGQQNGPMPNSAVSDIKANSLEGGVRLSYQKWWSPYFLVGLGQLQNKLNVSQQNVSYFSYGTYNYVNLIMSAGLDALYTPTWLGWIGVYGGAELQLTQTLFATTASWQMQSNAMATPPQGNNQHGMVSVLSGVVNFGVFAQF